MDKFWKWMEENNYSDLKCEKDRNIYFAYDDMPNQMLIGYMIEYIRERLFEKNNKQKNKRLDDIIGFKWCHFTAQFNIYKELESIIKLIDEE